MLTDFQKRIAEHIATETLSVALGSHDDPRDKQRLKAVGYYAFALFADLTSSGYTLEFSALMIKNRGLQPSNPLFFMHVSSLTDFVHMVSKLPSSAAVAGDSAWNIQPKANEQGEPLFGLEMD